MLGPAERLQLKSLILCHSLVTRTIRRGTSYSIRGVTHFMLPAVVIYL